MPTPREIAFDQLVEHIEYIAGASFKRDTLDGGSAEERTAQNNLGKRFAGILMNYQIEWFGFDGKKQAAGRKATTLSSFLGWIDSGLNVLTQGINRANEGIAGLTAAVKALSEKQGVDPAVLSQLIDKAVAEAAEKHLSEIGTYELRKVEES